MKKQLIAVAVAAVFAAPVAMADVEVYGKAHVSVASLDNNAADSTTAVNGSRISMLTNNSNIGFRGGEDLGGGLKAEYQAETALNWDAGGWGNGRDTFVGLAGDWGAVRVGRGNSPFKMATNSLDPFGDTALDYNNIMGQSPAGNVHDTRLSNSIWYNSADMNGMSFQAMYQFNDRTGETNNMSNSKPDAYSLGGQYKAGPLFVGVGYQSLGEAGGAITTGDGVDKDDNAWRVGASYMVQEGTTIGVAYENVDSGQGTTDTKAQDRNAYFVSATHKLGATTLALSYAAADKVADAADTQANQIALGVMHSLSKMTSVYGAYGKLTAKESSGAGYSMLGTSVSPSSGGTGDKEATAVVVGIVHSFSSK